MIWKYKDVSRELRMQLSHFYRNLFAFCRPVSPASVEGGKSLACLGDKIGCAQLSLKKVGRRGEKAANLEFCARPFRLCFFALQLSCALEWNARASSLPNQTSGEVLLFQFLLEETILTLQCQCKHWCKNSGSFIESAFVLFRYSLLQAWNLLHSAHC